MRQHVGQWFCAALWLVPLLGLCGWVGAAALPRSARAKLPARCAQRLHQRFARRDRGLRCCARFAPVRWTPCPACRRCRTRAISTARQRRACFSPAVAGTLSRVYVPNLRSNDVYVIDPQRLAVVDRFKVGASPQHVVPSWDLKTLWVANNGTRRRYGSLTPIDPKTGQARPGHPGRRSLQPLFHAGRPFGDRRRRTAQAARLPRSAHDGAAAVARRPAAAPASTTPISRSTAATRSSPASSAAAVSSRSTWSITRCSAI